MRVIAGEFRSRKIKTLPGLDVRPTPDRLRETLFNVLATRIEGKVFLDAYAGTGSVGIEALSRGARRAIFIEKTREAVEVIRENLSTLGILARATVLQGRAAQLLARHDADVIFIDPPYPIEKEYELALSAVGDALGDALGEKSPELVVAQHATRAPLKEQYGRLERFRALRQGDNTLSFYQVRSTPTVDSE